ncbi:MAG TPA: flippase-like domain-containing protein [Candidatus Saccharimonadales bacterium]|nr:flippase-like domain-containing protein [Candidatus Saccharimonadales bacterium]
MLAHKQAFHIRRRHLVLLFFAAIAVYVLLPQLGDFRTSWQLLRHPEAPITAAAVLLTAGTYIAGAGTYCFLAFRPLSFGRTLLVQFAAMFVNRLLPAGIGAVGANYLYLRHAKHTASQAVSVVALNNLLGLVGHALLLLAAISFFSDDSFTLFSEHAASWSHMVEFVVVAIAALIILSLVFGRHKMKKAWQDIRIQLSGYQRRPLSLAGALCTSVTLTLCNMLALFCCLLALGVSLPFTAVLMVFTFGVSVGAAVPTPGGLGGFEAGLAAGFVAYGVDPASALAAALLYRLISYWLPLLGGALAFIISQKYKLFSVF